MALRIVTGVVLIAAVVALAWWGPAWLLTAIAALIAVLALIEFFALGERVGLRAFKKWTIVCAVGLFYAQYAAGMVVVRRFGDIWLGNAVVSNLTLTTRPVSIDAIL